MLGPKRIFFSITFYEKNNIDTIGGIYYYYYIIPKPLFLLITSIGKNNKVKKIILFFIRKVTENYLRLGQMSCVSTVTKKYYYFWENADFSITF